MRNPASAPSGVTGIHASVISIADDLVDDDRARIGAPERSFGDRCGPDAGGEQRDDEGALRPRDAGGAHQVEEGDTRRRPHRAGGDGREADVPEGGDEQAQAGRHRGASATTRDPDARS